MTARHHVDPERIRTTRHVTAMVALDSFDLIAARIRRLLDAGRRITLVTRPAGVDSTPDVVVGLTLDRLDTATRPDGTVSLYALLTTRMLHGFGFTATPDRHSTEAAVWARRDRSRSRTDMTEVRVIGGLPGGEPAHDDRLVIRHWNGEGDCWETIVAFDHATRHANGLTAARDALRAHLDNFENMQSWDNRAMFGRLMAVLDAAAGNGRRP